MSKYTTQQIRAAIYRAAANIEGGARYDFFGHGPEGKNYEGVVCGPCMWGHIGLELNLPMDATNLAIAFAIGINSTERLYEMHKFGDGWTAKSAVTNLRAFADEYFPGEPVAPSSTSDATHVPGDWSLCPWRPAGVRT